MALPGPARVNEPAFGKGGGGGRKNFLDLADLAPATLREILDLGAAFKRGAPPGGDPAPLAGKTLAMIFEKPSTRTRVSFEVGMRQLGGEVVIMSHSESQLGRGETIADTARVLSRYVDVIMLRTVNVAHLNDMAQYATVPVINGLSDRSHPCQLMADIMTFEERLGPIAGRVVAWSGDGNNVAASWIEAAVRFGFTLRLACPEPLRPPARVLDWAASERGDITVTIDPKDAVSGADCVVTDTWLSMGPGTGGAGTGGAGTGGAGTGEDRTREERIELLTPYRVDDGLMALAKPDAIFLHCLPASREREVAPSVIDGPRSAVWDEAENRLHTQKGILTWCLA
ncbi:MAG: ornithine carbamoyltransferase [Proteobacteria bacterium]|nr:ornithine carbamoyltransferase [Pseudomonadota bacterium]MCH8097975.1 ornithine carbamoyltransferase [Pseudomonadota bacterium]